MEDKSGNEQSTEFAGHAKYLDPEDPRFRLSGEQVEQPVASPAIGPNLVRGEDGNVYALGTTGGNTIAQPESHAPQHVAVAFNHLTGKKEVFPDDAHGEQPINAAAKLGSAMRYLNEQTPKNWDAVEILNKAWGEGFREWAKSRLESPAPMSASELAQEFHETYERLASQFGYETRKESAVPWESVPEQNKQLMTAVCKCILDSMALKAFASQRHPTTSPAPMSAREWLTNRVDIEIDDERIFRNGYMLSVDEQAELLEAFAAQSQPNLWKETVIDACVVNHLSWDENDPRKTLANLIAWECKVALDPLVSEEARKLQSPPSVSEEKIAHEIVMLFDPFLNLTESGKVQARNDVLSILKKGDV